MFGPATFITMRLSIGSGGNTMSSHHELIEELAELLDEWDYKLDRLSHRVADLPKEVQQQTRDQLQKLKDFRENIRVQEKELRSKATKSVDELEELIDIAQDTFVLLYSDLTPQIKVEFC
jgi:DNA repair exonuclease SbcCD ATPase subunit